MGYVERVLRRQLLSQQADAAEWLRRLREADIVPPETEDHAETHGENRTISNKGEVWHDTQAYDAGDIEGEYSGDAKAEDETQLSLRKSGEWTEQTSGNAAGMEADAAPGGRAEEAVLRRLAAWTAWDERLPAQWAEAWQRGAAAEETAAALDRRLQRSLLPAAAAGTSLPSGGPQEIRRSGEADAAALSRLYERDARRYDSCFELPL